MVQMIPLFLYSFFVFGSIACTRTHTQTHTHTHTHRQTTPHTHTHKHLCTRFSEPLPTSGLCFSAATLTVPFSLLLNGCLPSQIFILHFTDVRMRCGRIKREEGVEREREGEREGGGREKGERERETSIKNEKHLKCLKRSDDWCAR